MGIRVEEKKKHKQEALLMSAFDLFTSKGINNTSISDIVKQAKMAKGTFYLYFKDKYDIRDRLIAHEASRLFEKADRNMEGRQFDTLEEYIVCLADQIIDLLCENKALLRFISKNLSWAIFSNIRISQLDNMNCMDIFNKLIEESGRSFRNKELMIYLIVELVNSSCYSVILHEKPCTIEELKPELSRTICSILEQFEVAEL